MSSHSNIYARLAGYARPYSMRIAIGILAGFICGASIVGLLAQANELLNKFGSSKIEETTAEKKIISLKTLGKILGLPVNVNEKGKYKSKQFIDEFCEKFNMPRYNNPEAKTGVSWQLMAVGAGVMTFFVLLRGIGIFANTYYMRWVGARVVMDIRNHLFQRLQAQSLKFYSTCDIGKLMSRITNDANVIEHTISKTIADLTRAPLELAAILTFIVYKAIQLNQMVMVLAMAVGFPLCMLPVAILGRFIKRYTKRALKGISSVTSRMQENFSGIRVVKAFHMEENELMRFRRLNRNYFRSMIKALKTEVLMTPATQAMVFCLAGIMLVYFYKNNWELGDILTFCAAAILGYKPIKQLSKVNASLQRSKAAAEHIFDLIDTDTCLPENEHPVKIDEFEKSIECKNMSFSYFTAGKPALQNINLQVKKGEVIAFVGGTGAGKTTLVNLLARFYDPTDGAVILDRIDLRDMEIASLRKLIGVVTQETILFNDSIAANIAYGTPNATPEEIADAAKRANAHDFIMEKDGGYDFVVGENGFQLSGGQRQRICIARAILKNPPILILDEATSALDTVTEQLVQDAINNLMESRTVFAIAHRLSTVRHADMICVLENGKIIERGTHEHLYRTDGVYKKLCNIQFKEKPTN